MNLFKENTGFTLIEMLVASAVASIILLMIYSAYSSIIKSVNYGKVASEYYEQLNIALNRIDADISFTYWKKDKKNLQFVCTIDGKSSILNFVTSEMRDLNIFPGLEEQYARSDVHETGYFVQKEDNSSEFNLIRRYDMHYVEVFTEGGTEEVLLKNVHSLNFKFQYGSDWTDTWDSRDKKRIPKAVKIILEVINPFNNIEKYEIISLPGMAYE